jgi:hypothetical protein
LTSIISTSDITSKYSYVGNVSKIGDLSYGTLYIVINSDGRYTNVYDNLNLDPNSRLLSFTIKNNTKAIWINLDPINKHGIELINSNTGTKLLSSAVPFGGTVEYTFTTPGNYLFFDQDHKKAGKIIVSSSIDMSKVFNNRLRS